MKCPRCGYQLKDSDYFCPTCGKAIPEIKLGYHVTKEKDLPRIMNEGLIPQVGPRTKSVLPIETYDYSAVMLWPSLSDAEEFKELMAFHEGEKCVILEVSDIGKYRHKVVKKKWTGPMSTEIHILERIPPSGIRVLK